jgi:hypothetical protein
MEGILKMTKLEKLVTSHLYYLVDNDGSVIKEMPNISSLPGLAIFDIDSADLVGHITDVRELPFDLGYEVKILNAVSRTLYQFRYVKWIEGDCDEF